MNIKYQVEVSPVKEVTLLGSADWNFWKELLAKESLVPVKSESKTQISITATEAKFMGIRFRELVIFLPVHPQGNGEKSAGVFLAHAFNSVRFFAWVERNFFSTPYYHGKMEVDTGMPVSMGLSQRGEVLFRAEMSKVNSTDRMPTRNAEECWEGPVFLPGKEVNKQEQGKFFFARLAGQIQAYPFNTEDRALINPSGDIPVLQWLRDSQFEPKEWTIRETATHAKSKTMRRQAVKGLISE